MSKVRILNVSRVSVPETQTPPPNAAVKLTVFDMVWIGLPPIQRLFLFPQTLALPSFPALVDALKSSLSATLLRFHPLAGELAFVPATGLVEIDCSAPLPGVAFVEAEAAADLDLARLVADPAHDAAAFRSLVPELDARELPAPALAVQATAFPGGGAALGLSAHHAAVDGRALWLFVDAWAATCRGAAAPPPPPKHDRAALFSHSFADEIARQLLRSLAPDLPIVSAASACAKAIY